MSIKSFDPRAGLGRREVLAGAGALALTAALGPIGCAAPGAGLYRGGRFADDPFTLGVASGDPLADRVVIWTRLSPRPLDADGGMATGPVTVRWQVAGDERFSRILREGEATAHPEDAHSVHVDVGGLEPARGYFYRFIAAGAASPTGQTRTAPAPGMAPGLIRIAQVGCQNYEQGLYTAYGHIAAEDLDLVIHTGDYIYEGAARGVSGIAGRHHPDHVCRTLAQYRLRYALYKGDRDLKAAHAAHPFAVTFDDHEVANNFSRDSDGRGGGGAAFLARRAAAFKAWWEHMPVRAAQRPQGAAILAHRSLDFGALVRINLCDTRQHRTRQPCGDGVKAPCDETFSATATMFGAAQETWLTDRLARSPMRWNVIAQQVLMAELDRDRDPGAKRFDMDKWDGYQVARRRLLDLLVSARVANPVVLSGDIHRHIAAELRTDFARHDSPVVATEFVNSSISSGGDGSDTAAYLGRWRKANPHLRYLADRRGYVRHAIAADAWRADFRVLDKVTTPGGTVSTGRSFVVEAGRPTLTGA